MKSAVCARQLSWVGTSSCMWASGTWWLLKNVGRSISVFPRECHVLGAGLTLPHGFQPRVHKGRRFIHSRFPRTWRSRFNLQLSKGRPSSALTTGLTEWLCAILLASPSGSPLGQHERGQTHQGECGSQLSARWPSLTLPVSPPACLLLELW